MDVREDQLLVDECDKWMESALHKGICLHGNGSDWNGILGDIKSALDFMPNCGPILDCCAMLNFMLGDISEAREYHMRASRNKHCFVSERTSEVCKFIWIEFMNWTICTQLGGTQIIVKYEEELPGLPRKFQSVLREAQIFKGDFHFSVAIKRTAEIVELTLTLEYAEIEVSNFVETGDFQGYFPYAFEIDVSPDGPWSEHSTFLTVKTEGRGQTSQPIQQQQTAGYNAQVGIGGGSALPSANFGYSFMQAISSFRFPEVMTAARGTPEGNDKAMRIVWKMNTYENGDPFVVEAVRKIRKLPFSPDKKHRCDGSDIYQGKWVVPLNIAGGSQYEFRWMIRLKAHFALLRRISRNFLKSVPEALTYEYAPDAKVEMSDFYSTSTERMFHF